MDEQLTGSTVNCRAGEKGTLTQGSVPPLGAASCGGRPAVGGTAAGPPNLWASPTLIGPPLSPSGPGASLAGCRLSYHWH